MYVCLNVYVCGLYILYYDDDISESKLIEEGFILNYSFLIMLFKIISLNT